jgi:hypothetical protein
MWHWQDDVMCKDTTACEDERHAIYDALHRMIRRLPLAPGTAASQGEAGQQHLLATSTLVLDNVQAEADPSAPLSAGGAVRHDPATAQFLGSAPPPASAAAPHVASRAVAAGVQRADPSLQAGGAGPSGPRAAFATAASCDSEAGPLCGLDRSRCIQVVIKMDAGGSSIFGNSNPYPHANPYLASGVVVATSRFFWGRQMDHILSITASDPLRGMVQLMCVATVPGLVDNLETARNLRRAIADEFHGAPCKVDAAIQVLQVVLKRSFWQLEPPWRTRFETTRRFTSS